MNHTKKTLEIVRLIERKINSEIGLINDLELAERFDKVNNRVEIHNRNTAVEACKDILADINRLA